MSVAGYISMYNSLIHDWFPSGVHLIQQSHHDWWIFVNSLQIVWIIRANNDGVYDNYVWWGNFVIAVCVETVTHIKKYNPLFHLPVDGCGCDTQQNHWPQVPEEVWLAEHAWSESLSVDSLYVVWQHEKCGRPAAHQSYEQSATLRKQTESTTRTQPEKSQQESTITEY